MNVEMPPGCHLHAIKPPRPPQVVDRALLLDPAAFGEDLRPTLECVRRHVLEVGSAETRRAIEEVEPALRSAEIAWARRLIAARPPAAEIARNPYFRFLQGYVVIGLRHRLPCSDARAGMRLWSEGVPLESYVALHRLEADKVPPEHPFLERMVWPEFATTFTQCWYAEVPHWHEGDRPVAVEIFPRPTSFFHAAAISAKGFGRIVVDLPIDDSSARHAELLASGWCSTGIDRGGMSGSRLFPYGGPPPATLVHVSDSDLFALVAARTWTPSLADAAWLATRPERLAIR